METLAFAISASFFVFFAADNINKTTNQLTAGAVIICPVNSDNNITTVKNKEVKNYDDDNIKRVDYIKDNIYLVSLENYIELIKVG